MTSKAKKKANRENSRKSTGPKSTLGKKRSSRNAFRHGLGIPLFRNPQLAADAEILARQIYNDDNPHLFDLAREIAVAEIDLSRIRKARAHAFLLCFVAVEFPAPLPPANLEAEPRDESPPADAEDYDPQESLDVLLTRLKAIDRYELRATSRRNKAMRRFEATRVVQACCPEIVSHEV